MWCGKTPYQHSGNAVSIHQNKLMKKKVIGHMPDALTKVVHGLMSEWKLLQVKVKTDGQQRDAPEGAWMPNDGINIPFVFFCMGKSLINVLYNKR